MYEHLTTPPDMKRCGRCDTDKPRSDFGKDRSRRDGLFSYCIPCRKTHDARMRALRYDAAAAQHRAYYAANRATILKQNRAYYAANHDRIREVKRRYAVEHAEEGREQARRWRRDNPDRATATRRLYYASEQGRLTRRAGHSRRRAAKNTAPGYASAAQVAGRIAMWGGLCWMCGAPARSIDHVIPLSRGGSQWPANLRPACLPCNRRKSNHSVIAMLRASR